jgi:uncharacterized phage protein (TIGR02220 family)
VRQYVVPAQFFKAIADKGNLYSRIWVYWLGDYVDEIFEPDFIEKQVKNLNRHVKEGEIIEIYQYGVQFLQQDFKIIEPKKKKASKIISKEDRLVAENVIEYMNLKCGTTFKKKGSNIEIIVTRISEGFTISDFKLVIDKKTEDWKGSDYQKYLRPITLFAKTKFENYLNSNDATKRPSNNFAKFAESVQRAKELIGLHNK